jgi:anti-sigma B factor antagonist
MKPGAAPSLHPSTLTIETQLREGIAILRLRGRLSDALEQKLVNEVSRLQEAGTHRIVVECSGLEYLNSRGVSAFVSVIDGLREAGGDLKLAGTRPDAALVLDRLGVSSLIQRFGTVEEAVGIFAIPIEEFQSDGGLDVFVASTSGKVFHASACKSVRRIATSRIFASKKEARDAGLHPCRTCGDSAAR